MADSRCKGTMPEVRIAGPDTGVKLTQMLSTTIPQGP